MLIGADEVNPASDEQTPQIISYNDVGDYGAADTVGDSVTPTTLGGTAIGYTGSDTVLASRANGAIRFWTGNGSGGWYLSRVAKGTSSISYGAGYIGIAVGNNTVGIIDTASTGALYWWTQGIGQTGWTRQLVGR